MLSQAAKLLPVVYILLGISLATPVAFAQYSVPADASSAQRGSSVQTLAIAAEEREPSIARWEMGASLNFLTSGPSLHGRELAFTDLVLMRVHGLISIKQATELFAGIDIMPKQPSYTDELIWQGALLGARHRINDASAVWARGQGGPQLGQAGWWIMGDAAVQHRISLERVLFWESTLGGTYTQLLFDEDEREASQPFWMAEVLARTGLALREPKGTFSTWLTFSFHFPVAGHPGPSAPDAASGQFLDPQTRVSMQLGALIGVSRKVDLFIEWSILDRGDVQEPATVLPIMNGGFDQTQLVFGFMRRFYAR